MISALNMSGKRFLLKTGDFILFIALALLAVLIFLLFGMGDHTMVTVTQNGEQIYRFDLSDSSLEGKEFKVEGMYENIICIRAGKLYVMEASCPDQLCTQSLPLTENGGVICCVPNGLVITAEGDKADWDVVIQ